LDLTFRIEGSSQALQLNEIKLAAGREDGIRIGVQGHLWFGDWEQADPLKDIDLKLQAHSHTTHALGTFIEKELPELGTLKGEARLHTVSGKHRPTMSPCCRSSASGRSSWLSTVTPTILRNSIRYSASRMRFHRLGHSRDRHKSPAMIKILLSMRSQLQPVRKIYSW
jgi:hypothetical protein